MSDNGNGHNKSNGTGKSQWLKPYHFSKDRQPPREKVGRPRGPSVRSAMERLLAIKVAENRDQADELAAEIWRLLKSDDTPARDKIRAAELFRKAVDGDRIETHISGSILPVEQDQVIEREHTLADLAARSAGDSPQRGANGNGSRGPTGG